MYAGYFLITDISKIN